LEGEHDNHDLTVVHYAALFLVKAIRMKRTREILLAIGYSLLILGISVAHIYELIATASIL